MTGDIPKIVFPKQVYGDQYNNNSNVEPVCDSPKVRSTSINKLKPPSSTSQILPSPNTLPSPPPPPPSLKFLKIDSASQYIESDHDEDNETITTTTDINTISSNFEINSTASSDLKQHLQPKINIEMVKIERIDEQEMSEEGFHESSDEDMYNKSDNITKGEVTIGDAIDNDQIVKVMSDTMTVRESVV